MLVRQRNIVGGEKNLQKILLNILKWRAPATFDPVLDHEELANDEDDPGQVADGEDANHTRQHESQVRLMSSFFPGADVRVPESNKDLFIFCLWICSSGRVIAPRAPLQDCIQKSVDALLREGKFKDLAFTKLHYASLLNDSAALPIIDSFKRLAKYHLVHA